MFLGSDGARIRTIHDISQPLDSGTAVWPGDRSVEMSWTMQRERGDSVNVAALCMTVHAGTHLDGPLHFEDGGATPADVPLERLIGRALVIDARGRATLDAGGHAMLGADLIDGVDLRREERVLLRCFEQVVAGEFPQAFPALAPALARKLADNGVKLVATESPSVDPVDSKTLEAHRILARGDVAIVENVVLSNVPAGRYTLVVLPLRLTAADSSPVRAVLLELE
ncbi:MAG: cyclase family protein [Longimicrobiales bacterium]